jgi:hypothetical protein
LGVATWKGLSTVPSPPAYVLEAEHAVAIAGFGSITTIPVANKPANRTGAATFDRAFKDCSKTMDTSFYLGNALVVKVLVIFWYPLYALGCYSVEN